MGWFRRNWLVPVWEAANLTQIRRMVRSQPWPIDSRTPDEWGEAIQQEWPHLLPLSDLRFGVNEVLLPVIVDGHGCVRAKTNRSSASLGSGIRSEVVLWPNEVFVYHGRD